MYQKNSIRMKHIEMKNKLTEDVSVTLWDRWELKPEKYDLETV